MSLADDVAAIKASGRKVDGTFREQIEKAEAQRDRYREQQRPTQTTKQGVDRSREYAPVSRPSRMRSLTRA